MSSEISLSKDLNDVKAHNNHHASALKPYLFVLVCLLIELHWNFTVCVSILFSNSSVQIGGAAYLQMRLIHGLLRNSFLTPFLFLINVQHCCYILFTLTKGYGRSMLHATLRKTHFGCKFEGKQKLTPLLSLIFLNKMHCDICQLIIMLLILIPNNENVLWIKNFSVYVKMLQVFITIR